MNTFKDKLTKTTKARKEELKQRLIEVEDKENSKLIGCAINHLYWLNDNFKYELEYQSNGGLDFWKQPIFGAPRHTKEEIDKTYEEIINNTSDELSKNFENHIGYEKYKNMKLSYSLVFQNSSLVNYKMNYDYLFVKGKIVNKIIKGIRDSKEFKSLEKKFHESGLVLSFQSERLETPNYILVLSTSWKD